MMRTLWLVAAIAYACLSIFSLRSLVGEIYKAAASAEHQVLPSGTLADRALALASQLSPWVPEIWEQRAYHAGYRRDQQAMLAYNREALFWASADARLWMSHVWLLAYAEDKSKDLEISLERLRHLAPAAPHIHLSKALLGIRIWEHAPDYLRQESMDSSRFMLQHHPGSFKRGLRDDQMELLACALVGADLKLGVWCTLIQRERQLCDRPNPNPAILSRCRELGLHR